MRQSLRTMSPPRGRGFSSLNKIDKDVKAATLSQMKITFEKSIVSACDIAADTIIEKKHLAYKKPGDGISARMFQEMLGKKTMNKIPVNTKLEWSIFNKKGCKE